MYHSVTFINSEGVSKNTWDDWHLVATSRPTLSTPEVKTKTIDIPGADGHIDLTTSLTGYPLFKNRTGSFEFYVMNGYQDWIVLYSAVMAFIHGKRCKMILEDDPDYFYEGRMSMSGWKSEKDWSKITLDYDVGPYKKSVFDSSIYSELVDILVDEGVSKEVVVSGEYYGVAPTVPVLRVSDMTGSAIGVKCLNGYSDPGFVRILHSGDNEVPEFTMYGDNTKFVFNPPIAADAYDATRGYLVGEYALYSSKVYSCIENVVPKRNFTASDWTLIKSAIEEFNPVFTYASDDLIVNGESVYKALESIVPLNEFDAQNWQAKGEAVDYNSQSIYNIGDFVAHSSTIYRCTTSVTTPEEFDSSKWESLGAAEYDNTVAYVVGEYCVYAGTIYVAVKTSVPKSGWDPSKWEHYAYAPVYDNHATYAVGEYCIHTTNNVDNFYRCSVATVLSAPFNASQWDEIPNGVYGGGAGAISIIFRKGLL